MGVGEGDGEEGGEGGGHHTRVMFQYILVLVSLARLEISIHFTRDFFIKWFVISGLHCMKWSRIEGKQKLLLCYCLVLIQNYLHVFHCHFFV